MALNPLGLYRLKLLGEIHGQATETAFHFQTRSNSTFTTYPSEINALITDFKAQVLPKIQQFAADDWRVKSILVVTLIPDPGYLVEDRLAVGAGLQGNDSLPSHDAGLLSIRTGISGRSGHGRIFFPGVPEDLSADSRLDGVALGFLQDIGNSLLARYGSTGTYASNRFGIFSRKLGVTRTLVPFPKLVYSHSGFMVATTAIARPEIATQRRRKLARGS